MAFSKHQGLKEKKLLAELATTGCIENFLKNLLQQEMAIFLK